MGSLTHATAVAHLRRGAPFNVHALNETVRVILPPTLKVVYRQAATQRVVSALMVYGNELAPHDARFVAGEHISTDIAMDLLWMHPDGSLSADELKTGTRATATMSAIQRQCAMQCQAGLEEFGDNFLGVRVVFIPERRVGWMDAQKRGEFSWH